MAEGEDVKKKKNNKILMWDSSLVLSSRLSFQPKGVVCLELFPSALWRIAGDVFFSLEVFSLLFSSLATPCIHGLHARLILRAAT